ncbi:MAG: M20/M25/M40 family metallo-hydrolase, partial [Pseudonocardiaceae bacterium]
MRVASTAKHIWMLVVLGVLTLVGAGSALALRPAEPVGTSAPTREFSARRAAVHLERIAAIPHPAGSTAGAQVRDYLVSELRRLGLSPTVQTSTTARAFPDRTHLVGTVSNVYAVIAGRAATGHLLLVAHYDSVPIGPGASDNGANVAAILEIVRALKAGAHPANDIGVVFTDAEEQGLLGARAFVDSGRVSDPCCTVVLNLEARGTSGPAVMFQTAGRNGGLMPTLRASGAVATSVSDEVYRMLPNDTDLTVFSKAGYRGLNFAFFDGSAHYHTPHDDLDHVDLSSVQDIGAAALAAARHLASTDLSVAGGADATYFTLFGWWTIDYPAWLVLPLGVAGVIGYALLLSYGRRNGLLLGHVARAAATFVLPLVTSGTVGLTVWYVLRAVRPEYAQFASGDTYRPAFYAFGQVCLVVFGLVQWYRWMRRWCSPVEMSASVLGWLAVLGLATATVLPGGAYLFTWPALIGCAVVAAAIRWTSEDSLWWPLVGVVPAIPATALLLPIVLLLLPALGVAKVAVPLVVTALLGATALGGLEVVPSRRTLTIGQAVAVLLGLALIGTGLIVDRYDDRHPRPVSLGYVVDADIQQASWLSASAMPDPVADKLMTSPPVRIDDRFPIFPGTRFRTGAARLASTLALPTLETLGTIKQGDMREVQLRLGIPPEAHSVAVYADTSRHHVTSATVN